MRTELILKGQAAKAAAQQLAILDTNKKNAVLTAIAERLRACAPEILDANAQDVENAQQKGTRQNMLDRLTLTEQRIADMAEGIVQVAALPDPVGNVSEMFKRPNGLLIGKMHVPIGVIGIIYEARPNVTADAAALCVKSGNAVILRGGSEAILSNKAIVKAMREATASAGVTPDIINLVEDTSRETATTLMRLNEYIDMLIPRGGHGLIQSVVQNATVPVIETGTGNCHVYVDDGADFDMARAIVINAKTSRPSVCNAMETLLVHKAAAAAFLPLIVSDLLSRGVEVRGCPATAAVCPSVSPAAEQDWETEYNDLILAVKVVDGIDEAIAHINRYGTRHSEAIVTSSYAHAQQFLKEVDAAAVYVNASTRFTDGFEFGFGAEIGISTQKMHARGPMGLQALTTTKYIIYGDGQIR